MQDVLTQFIAALGTAAEWQNTTEIFEKQNTQKTALHRPKGEELMTRPKLTHDQPL